jgi:hypothetical protein
VLLTRVKLRLMALTADAPAEFMREASAARVAEIGDGIARLSGTAAARTVVARDLAAYADGLGRQDIAAALRTRFQA